ncbi:MAB_1171c family putative transporter [Streptomyces sp. URMC 123]|uniref:MAB_1171c family putative transporter n=1 Tax=Streptomyces sp. URMC 123 TaxID=3423403 RepID=UPI003F1D1D6F
MTGVKSVVFPLCALVCALALLYKLRDLRSGWRDPALRALLAAFTLKGISFTLSTPTVAARVDDLLNVPNIGALGIHLSGGVGSSAAILIAIVFWVHPIEQARPKVRARIIAAVLCALVMFALWFAAMPEDGQRSKHYLLQNAHNPLVTGYLLLYVTAFGAGMIEIMRLCVRFGRVAGRQWLRRGLYTTAVGAGAYIVYCANRASAAVATQIGASPLEWELLTPVANGIGILFLASGLTMPSWGPQLTGLRRRIDNAVAHRRLHGLWRDLCRANPGIVLAPSDGSPLARFSPRDINYRLYRRVIEIQDGLLSLRPYMDPAVAEAATRAARAAGLPEPELHAAVHAARIEAALRAQREGRDRVDESVAKENFPVTDDDYAHEVSRLVSVARAYTALRRGRPLAPEPSPPVRGESPSVRSEAAAVRSEGVAVRGGASVRSEVPPVRGKGPSVRDGEAPVRSEGAPAPGRGVPEQGGAHSRGETLGESRRSAP